MRRVWFATKMWRRLVFVHRVRRKALLRAYGFARFNFCFVTLSLWYYVSAYLSLLLLLFGIIYAYDLCCARSFFMKGVRKAYMCSRLVLSSPVRTAYMCV